MDNVLPSFGAALFGAVFQEVLHWWYLRNKLSNRRYKVLLERRSYWIITALMVLMSAIGTAWFFGSRLEPLEVAVLAAAFPDIFRKFVTATKSQNVQLGPEIQGNTKESTVDLYFS